MERHWGWIGKIPTPTSLHSQMPVSLVSKNLSGITWDKETNTLFAVTNSPQEIVELTPEGQTLRKITLEGFSDTEDIAHLGGKRFAVVEERLGFIRMFDLTAQTKTVRIDETQGIDLGSRHPDNKGFESLCYDPVNQLLYTMLEKPPYDLLSVHLDTQPYTITRQHLDLDVKDVAALNRDSQGRLWIVSQESHCVVRMDKNRVAFRFMTTASGRNMNPEGFAFAPDGRMYFAEEPNLLSIFPAPGN